MTFEEWFAEHAKRPYAEGAEFGDCWQAAQKEARKEMAKEELKEYEFAVENGASNDELLLVFKHFIAKELKIGKYRLEKEAKGK